MTNADEAPLAELAELMSDDLCTMGFGRCSKLEWRRVRQEFIDCIKFQPSKDSQTFCVSLGLHLSFLPSRVTLNLPLSETPSFDDCELRKRLAPEGFEDCWWPIGTSDALRSEVFEVFTEKGEEFFCTFQQFPQPFVSIEVNELTSRFIERLLPGTTVCRRALLIARVYESLNDSTNVDAWTNAGLSHVGAAVDPKVALKMLRKKFKFS